MSRPEDIPNIRTEKKVVIELPVDIQRERDIRRFVKINGGFRKDLPSADKRLAERLLKEAGRTVEQGWDLQIVVPGFEAASATHRPMIQRHLLESTVVDLKERVKTLDLQLAQKNRPGRPRTKGVKNEQATTMVADKSAES